MEASPAQVLQALTSSAAAAACGVADRKGRLLPGYDGDVLVVRGDPTKDLAALHAVRIVVMQDASLSTPATADPKSCPGRSEPAVL